MGDLRVCHLLHDLALGGLENQVLRIVRATEDPSITYLVCHIGDDDSMATAFESAGAQVIGLDTGSADPLAQFHPRSLWQLASLLTDYDVDILHCHGSLYQHVIGRLSGTAVGRTVMGTYHSRPDSFHPATRWLERLTRPLSSMDVAVSKGVERSFGGSGREYRPGQEQLDHGPYTVYNGIDVEEFNAQVEQSDPTELGATGEISNGITYLNIGRYSPNKNQKLLLKAMNRVIDAQPDAHLYLVGWGELEGELRATASKLGLDDNVTITGRVSSTYGDVPSVYHYYAKADVFVLPSFIEGLSVVLLEAMASRLAIIASRIPGTTEAVLDEQTGYLVPPDSVDELAGAMMTIAKNDRWKRFGTAGYSHAKETFHLRDTVKSYLDIYRRLI